MIAVVILMVFASRSTTKTTEDSKPSDYGVDIGCNSNRPSLCSDGLCYEDYSFCRPFRGCTVAPSLLMCPNGSCTSDFSLCQESRYECELESFSRCADGVCRLSCDGIKTNGCPAESPFYCPTGKCTKSMLECTDYRCTLQRPYLCANFECSSTLGGCPSNAVSHMISEEQVEMEVDQTSAQLEVIRASSQADSNREVVSVRFHRSSLFYSPFTAGFDSLVEGGESSLSVSFKLEPVAMSQVTPSAFLYDNFDLESEKLTTLVFMKSVDDLQPHEFIRSSIFSLYIDGYEYNHFINGPFTLSVDFNKIANFPNSRMTPEEKQKLEDDAELRIDINDPSNYYCLGSFNKVTRTWTCASRNILSISETKIEFVLMTTGVFAVIYMPKPSLKDLVPCGFICHNKREIAAVLFVAVPLLLIAFTFVMMSFRDTYTELQKKVRAATKNDDEPFLDAQKRAEQETDDENVGVESVTHAYNNPLLFNDDRELSDLEKMEKNKAKLRFRNEKLLADKLKQLSKNMALKYELETMREEVKLIKNKERKLNEDNQSEY